jgi:hypothetical protein
MEEKNDLKAELPVTPPPVEAKSEEVKNEPVKIKKRPKQLVKDKAEDVIKINLDEEKKVEEPSEVIKVDLREKMGYEPPVVDEFIADEVTLLDVGEDIPVLEEITNEEPIKVEPTQEEVVEAIAEKQDTGVELPDNIQKVVDFMNDTGGSLEDYVKLNTDYASLNEQQLLKEFYQNTKPHLDNEEINFLMEDNFSFDEEVDEERDVKRKKLALKEQVADAKSHLDGLKSKYYEEIKAGSRLAPEQKKAVDFFNRYNEEQAESQKVSERQVNVFENKTNEVFNDQFKGFEYSVGEKKYRYNVKNADEIKTSQGNISNFVKKFLDKNSEMKDAAGYHKSLFTAMNPDAVANHFYNQGKADALKDSMSSAKNVDMTPRQSHTEIKQGGTTYKVISGEDNSRIRVKMRK